MERRTRSDAHELKVERRHDDDQRKHSSDAGFEPLDRLRRDPAALRQVRARPARDVTRLHQIVEQDLTPQGVTSCSSFGTQSRRAEDGDLRLGADL